MADESKPSSGCMALNVLSTPFFYLGYVWWRGDESAPWEWWVAWISSGLVGLMLVAVVVGMIFTHNPPDGPKKGSEP